MPTNTKRQKIYHDGDRKIAYSAIGGKHPLNVRPLGNSYFGSNFKGPSREEQMGHFSKLPEELFMELLTFVEDAASLKSLSHTSRVLYAYLYDEDLWKRQYTSKVQRLEREGKHVQDLVWRGSWRLSTLGIAAEQSANIQLPANFLCSDILYRPFQCSQVDYEDLFSKIIKEEQEYHRDALESDTPLTYPPGRIPRIPESYITLKQFEDTWNSKPFILTNKDNNRWPRWDLDHLLSRFPDVKFRQEAVRWPLSLYAKYLSCNHDESPLYLFDCSSIAMQTLRKEYDVPCLFQQDLFTTFGECRPDHSWLIIGSQRSGSTFHKDPNYTSAWNAALTGRKLWIMFPPSVCPPGVSTDENEEEVTCPVGIAEWVLSGFYNDSVKHPQSQMGMTFPGECMYVPSGWWHMVINIYDSVALTQNFVPMVKLAKALGFLKNKFNQISGFRPLEVKNKCCEMLRECDGDKKRDEDEDWQTIANYCDAFEKSNLQEYIMNEDCGEIMESCLPRMPVFSLFKKLLIRDGKEAELDSALGELSRKEKTELYKATGVSEAWRDLTEGAGFSFGFSEIDSE